MSEPRPTRGEEEPTLSITVRSLISKTPPSVMIISCFLARWLAMFLREKVLQGVLCIVLHLTPIGWIPATIWALIETRRESAA